MRLAIVFSVLIVYVCCAPLKNELEQRAKALDQRIKAEVKRLQAEKRQHLALLLEEEEKRLENLSGELAKVTDSEQVKTAVLEQELINLEFRVQNEIDVLRREHQTQELLLSNAHILRQYVNEEIQLLENIEGKDREQAHEVARALRREEQRLGDIANELTRAQDQRHIEILEVELRSIEVRLYEHLRRLHFDPSTAHPTGSTHAATHSASHTTARPSTRHTSAVHSTVHVTAHPTTRAPVTAH